jgi:hypothetical protein
MRLLHYIHHSGFFVEDVVISSLCIILFVELTLNLHRIHGAEPLNHTVHARAANSYFVIV